MIVKALFATAAVLAMMAATPALAAGAITALTKGTPQKMPEGSKLQTKDGYWVECDYSGLGDVCHYVYSFSHSLANGDPAPGAKYRRLKADAAKVQTKDGYWVECDAVGENCHYVFAFAPKSK